MENKEIYVTKPVLPPMEEYVSYLERIWKSGILTNMGELHNEFRQKIIDMIGTEFCIPLVNGHATLELTLQAFGLKGEVITTPFTFASTTHAIVRNSLTPVFCDIREDDCTIDVELIEGLINEKTCAILPVHVYGMPCNVYRLEEIGKKYGLPVIYDCAHAFGVEVDGRSIMSYGDASMVSFHATKAFHSIEGGCATVSNFDMLMRVYQLSNFGIMGEERVTCVGANAKMNEFQAAMGLCNLNHLDENIAKRKLVMDRYKDMLGNVEGISFLSSSVKAVKYNYSYCPIFIDEQILRINRDDVYRILREKHIYARKYFYPLTNQFECYKDKFYRGEVSVAQKKSKQVLALPIYPELSLDDVEYISELILSFCDRGY